jgi:hypothetical protein
VALALPELVRPRRLAELVVWGPDLLPAELDWFVVPYTSFTFFYLIGDKSIVACYA